MSAQDDRDGVDASAAVAGLVELLALWRRQLELDLRVSAPARVVTYNPATQRATVSLEQLPVAFEDGEEVPQPPILIPEVAVRWQGSSTGYVTVPLAPNDTGHVVFSDRCLSEWLRTGVPGDPINARTHALADAVFEPGLRPATNPIVPPTSMVSAVLEGPLVALGRAATSPAVLGTELVAAFTAFTTAVNAAAGIWNTATGAPTPAGPGIPAAATPIANGTFVFALINANIALTAAMTTWLSAKVLVE